MASSTPAIRGNTIVGNEKGGIDCSPFANAEIANNIITGNGTGWGIWVEPNALPVIKYNDIWNNAKGTTGPTIPNQTGINGNISVDPNFVNADANNYHLDPNSPCVNAGDPNYIPEPNETDIDAEPRVFDGRIDMGADEMVTNPFDLNTDGIVDYYDLDVLIDEWLRTSPGLQTDFNSDGIVNFADFAELAEQWLWTAAWRQ